MTGRFIGIDTRPSRLEYTCNDEVKNFRTVTGIAVVTNNIYDALNIKNFDVKYRLHIINNKDYQKITPLDMHGFDITNMVNHPIYFLNRPKKSTIDLEMVIPQLPKLMNEIYESGGSLKYFNQEGDKNLITQL